jgi:hypothetical protein
MKRRDRVGRLVRLCARWWGHARRHLVRGSHQPERMAERRYPLCRPLKCDPTSIELTVLPTKFPATVDQGAIGEITLYEKVVVHKDSLIRFVFVVDGLHSFSSGGRV